MKRESDDNGSVELKYDIIPANAPSFAADTVRDARKVSGVVLDYSVASLALVDAIIEGFRQEGCDADAIPATLFGFGCYVGEVFVRHAGYRWRATMEDELEAVSMPLVIERDDLLVNPIGKVFKRMRHGEGDNLPHFYESFSQPSAAGE